MFFMICNTAFGISLVVEHLASNANPACVLLHISAKCMMQCAILHTILAEML